MHPVLKYFNDISTGELNAPLDNSMTLIYDLGLVPRSSTVIPCDKCGAEMRSIRNRRRKLGWQWMCANSNKCHGSVLNPLKNTFFYHSPLTVAEILCIVVGFVQETSVFDLQDAIFNLHLKRGEGKRISQYSIEKVLCLCRKVCAIYVSHNFYPLNTWNAMKLVEVYRNQRIPKSSLPLGERIQRFLEDIREVYPGFGKEGKQFLMQDLPILSTEDVESVLSLT